jgi:hypothetical protein
MFPQGDLSSRRPLKVVDHGLAFHTLTDSANPIPETATSRKTLRWLLSPLLLLLVPQILLPDAPARCTCTWLKETAHLKLNRDKWPSVKVILLWAQAQLSACSRIPSKRARLSLREFARVWLAEVSSFDRIAGSSSTPVSRSFFSLEAVGL